MTYVLCDVFYDLCAVSSAAHLVLARHLAVALLLNQRRLPQHLPAYAARAPQSEELLDDVRSKVARAALLDLMAVRVRVRVRAGVRVTVTVRVKVRVRVRVGVRIRVRIRVRELLDDVRR